MKSGSPITDLHPGGTRCQWTAGPVKGAQRCPARCLSRCLSHCRGPSAQPHPALLVAATRQSAAFLSTAFIHERLLGPKSTPRPWLSSSIGSRTRYWHSFIYTLIDTLRQSLLVSNHASGDLAHRQNKANGAQADPPCERRASKKAQGAIRTAAPPARPPFVHCTARPDPAPPSCARGDRPL